jgi:hypothetical protein
VTLGLGHKGGIIGLGEETVYGTAVTRTKFIEITSDGTDLNQDRMKTAGINSISVDKADIELGRITSGGDLGFEARYEGNGLIYKHALGDASVVEVASFVITGGSNDDIDFKEDGGGEQTATLSAATYKMGERGNYLIDATNNDIDFKEDAGSEVTATLTSQEYASATLLAAEIKTQMESAGSGTYTVTHSGTTNKFTIAVSGSASSVQILWKTGTNGADGNDTSPSDLLGFNDLDTLDEASLEGDNSVFDPSGTLCAEIKTQLEATGAGTYQVTFSESTKKMTIAVSGAVAAVQVLPVTGTNTATSAGPTLGFAADSSSAASITADTAVVTVFDTTYLIKDALQTGLSVEVDADTESKLFEGSKINTLDMTIETDGFLNNTISIVAEDMTKTTVTASTTSSSPLVKFNDTTVTYGGNPINGCIKSANINLANNLDSERFCLNSSVVKEPVRSPERIAVTGTLTVDFETADAFFSDYDAGTERAVAMTATSTTVIKAAFVYTMTVNLPNIILDNATQKIADPGIIPLELPFTAYADGTTREMNIVLRNTIGSV